VVTSEHVREQDFEAYLTRLIPNQIDAVIEAHFSECNACAVKLMNTADDSLSKRARLSAEQPSDGRRENRYVVNGSAVLQILNPFSAERSDVLLVDLSANGLKLLVRKPVRLGSFVKVRMKSYIAFGDSRHCGSTAEGYFVGVQLRNYVSRKLIPTETRNQSWPTITEPTFGVDHDWVLPTEFFSG
jgi:hypothetical protein